MQACVHMGDAQFPVHTLAQRGCSFLPMKNNTNWFRHDATASDDTKMLEVFGKFGTSGIGCYWMLVEALYKNEGYMSDDAIRSYANRNTFVPDFLQFSLDIGLFMKTKSGEWCSQRTLEELHHKEEKSKKARASIMERWQGDAKKKNIRTYNGRNTDVILGEERRGEEIREEKTTTNVVESDTKKSYDSIDERIVFLLAEGIRKTNPAFEQKYPTNLEFSPRLDSWAKEISKMRRIDNATQEQMQIVIQWLFYVNSKDANFWKGNILSAATFREKFQKLVAAIQREQSSDNKAVFIS